MLFRRKIRSLRRIPRPCFTGKRPLSSVAAADAVEELVSDSGVLDPKSCLREILALSNLELGSSLSCRPNSSVVAKSGVLKQKEMVSCPRWSEHDPRLARLEVCHALAKEGRLKQMREILRRMLDDEGDVDEALELSEYMQTDGIETDVVIYNILINGCRLLGLMSEIWKLIRMMIQHGLQPDLVTYTILIAGLCEGGNVDEGLKMRKEMLSKGFKLNIVTYSVLVNALCRKGHINEVEELLGEIKEIGLDMDLVAYSILINGYCKLGEIEKALQVCQTMCSKRIMANSFAHGGILSGLCKNGLVPEAKWYLENLAATGQTLNIMLYNIVIDGYAKIGDVEGSVMLYEQIIRC
ncbi:hypothetical protein B296_00005298 [Ensete ventricosum]|uniref:Pentatricopeptide repeat-containing protein-mitochondrial domain-containing protein n=1 Tax=Ensete ventricosum TaxID=4639 RepID=A0A427BCA4_ENSVE|nr:hypothetical protein B296_00005298 [Ensete ventricosum]